LDKCPDHRHVLCNRLDAPIFKLSNEGEIK
jgi:hypothetical protein